MKRLSLLALLSVFALTHAALAEDQQQANKNKAARHAPAGRRGNAAVSVNRAVNLPHQSLQQQKARSFVRPQGNSNGAAQLRAAQIRGAMQADRHHNIRNGGHTPKVQQNFANSGQQNLQNNAEIARRGRHWSNNKGNNAFANGQNARRGVRNPNFNRARWHSTLHWERNRHDRGWWRNHYTRFALFGGGYYYWNSGYWYPAYGYDPYFSNYSYDAPIYAYNDQDPGRVIANVQSALQELGYDPGAIDGTFGPNTRRALLDYQRNNGLDDTGEIDDATLDSLGLR